jgi:threonine/homoserine/homoserine lactone efflux protein
MTVTIWQFIVYAGGVLVLFLTPGPVWVALTARALSGGFRSAWPLAVGVSLGDFLWPLLAILGVTWIVDQYSGVMFGLKLFAAFLFVLMGFFILRDINRTISADGRLTKPGLLAGFTAGVAVIIGNPKAIVFYMAILPGFFDLRHVTVGDIAVIIAISMTVPLMGNLALSLVISRMRAGLTEPRILRRINLVAGCLLIFVGLVIPFV